MGYSTSQGVIGEISYTERNLMGTGQSLEVKLSGSFAGDGLFQVGWTEPHFLDTNLAFGVDAVREERQLYAKFWLRYCRL